MEKIELNLIAEQFQIEGKIIKVIPFGEGHINTTYKVFTDKKNYILQQINSNLFTDVKRLMQNIVSVTEYLKKKIIERNGDPLRETLTVIKSKNDENYYCVNDMYFRCYLFIENATCYQIVKNRNDFYQAALVFGNFANLLSDFDAKLLYEPIPHFHDTAKRYNDFIKAVNEDKFNRVKLVKKEIDFVMERENLKGKIVDKLNSGEIPLKVTHNDTKLNNIMIDDKTGKAICVIDLDTIMPGSILYDFGDSIRFGCNTGYEDEKDLSKVNFDLKLFETFADGYIFSQKNSMTLTEMQNLALSAIIMTYECGMRFLADYLNGDVYFHVSRDMHNVDRCRTQFKLITDMENNFDKMNDICNKFYIKYKN